MPITDGRDLIEPACYAEHVVIRSHWHSAGQNGSVAHVDPNDHRHRWTVESRWSQDQPQVVGSLFVWVKVVVPESRVPRLLTECLCECISRTHPDNKRKFNGIGAENLEKTLPGEILLKNKPVVIEGPALGVALGIRQINMPVVVPSSVVVSSRVSGICFLDTDSIALIAGHCDRTNEALLCAQAELDALQFGDNELTV